MHYSDSNLVWIDLEMTGLDPERDRIIEIATIVTNARLSERSEGPTFAIRCDEAILDGMDEWNTRHHGQSGLTARVRASMVTTARAERETLAFLSQLVPAGASPMCGNSICQDRRFLYKYMPALAAFFHYRNIDVSTLKELARRWAPALPAFHKQGNHLALDDIRESIAELEHYRACFLKVPDSA